MFPLKGEDLRIFGREIWGFWKSVPLIPHNQRSVEVVLNFGKTWVKFQFESHLNHLVVLDPALKMSIGLPPLVCCWVKSNLHWVKPHQNLKMDWYTRKKAGIHLYTVDIQIFQVKGGNRWCTMELGANTRMLIQCIYTKYAGKRGWHTLSIQLVHKCRKRTQSP